MIHLLNYNLKKLSISPICGAKYFNYDHGWKQHYAENFNAGEKERPSRHQASKLKDLG